MTHEAVLVDTSKCPVCGTVIDEYRWSQPALFFHGGYGHTLLFVKRRCSGCGWELPLDVRAVSPRR